MLGIKYYCDQCDYTSNRIADLKLHIFSVHEKKVIHFIFLYLTDENGEMKDFYCLSVSSDDRLIKE